MVNVLFVFLLFLLFHVFGFEGRILVLIDPVPVHNLHFFFLKQTELTKHGILTFCRDPFAVFFVYLKFTRPILPQRTC